MDKYPQVLVGKRNAVLHLVWREAGVASFEKFVASYRKYKAGCDHQLLIAFKGFENKQDTLDNYLSILAGLDCKTIHVPNEGKDIFAYGHVVSRILGPCKAILFLNSSTEILCVNWLLHFQNALQKVSVGVVGATGSWERRSPSDDWPNKHLRTNAFYGELELLRKLEWGNGDGGLLFEAGSTSLYAQVTRLGLDVVVVGRDGVAYSNENWKDAGTFRSFGQHNLIIADNRTRDYQVGDTLKRTWFHTLAWHEYDPGPNPDKRGHFSYVVKRLIYTMKSLVKSPSSTKKDL